MSESSAAAEEMVKIVLDGSEYALRILGNISVGFTEKLTDAVKSSKPSRGKFRLKELLQEGNEICVFSIFNRDVDTFTKEAKRYGITYSLIKDRKNKDPLSVVDVLVKKEDVVRVNRIIERNFLGDREKETVPETVKKAKALGEKDLSGQFSRKMNITDFSKERSSVREKLKRFSYEKERDISHENIRNERQ